MKFFCAKCEFTAASKPSVDKHYNAEHTTIGKMMKTKTKNKPTSVKKTVKAVMKDKTKPPSGSKVTFLMKMNGLILIVRMKTMT